MHQAPLPRRTAVSGREGRGGDGSDDPGDGTMTAWYGVADTIPA